MNAKDYNVEWAESLNDLNVKVVSQIKAGWQPIGGVSVSINYNTQGERTSHVFFQAMIKPK